MNVETLEKWRDSLGEFGTSLIKDRELKKANINAGYLPSSTPCPQT